MRTIRESTKATRTAILTSAKEIFLTYGYQEASIRTIELLEDDMQLFHMLLKNDSGTYLSRFRKIYIERCSGFAMQYYSELYKRGLASNQLSEKTVYILSSSEFSMVCEIIADDSCKNGITPECKQAFLEAMGILLHGLEVALGIKKQEEPKHGKN